MRPLLIRIIKTSLFALLLVSLPQLLMAQIPVPDLSGRVVDRTGTLSEEQRQSLETKLAEFEARKGAQIVILIVPSTEGEVIEDFSMRVAEAWKIGRKGTDDGIVITVAKDDHKMRIEVGYGLEGAVPDALAKRIIREKMAPAFREDNYAGGLDAAVDSLILLIDGETLPPPADQGSFEEEESAAGGAFFFGPAAAAFVTHWFLPTPIAVLGVTVIAWVISIFVIGFSLTNLFIILMAAILGVTWYRFTGFGGSSSGGGGWSSSSGGSFSGGGGSFGGGGSSGSW